MVRLFMRDGYPTKLCLLLSLPQRRRMFRLCRIIGKREFNRMLREWIFDPTIGLEKYRQVGELNAKR